MASEEDYSDLTELESDDDYQSSKTKKKSNKSVRAGWRIRNALKVPRATTYTSQALYDQIYGGDINLEPEYQRDVVWSEVKQIGIIDSVFRNFYIPPVIFAVNILEDGSETKTCIDGKQRLTSIYKFMEGLIPHKDPITGEKLWYKDSAAGTGPKRRLLPDKYRRLFANKQIVCVEYQDITDSDEREIFQRVQLGMALTPAEKLQVVKTPRSDFVRELQNKYAKEDGWLGANKLGWTVSRGSDYRGIAQAVYCMVAYENLTAGVVGIAPLEKWLGIDEAILPPKRKSVEEAFELFADIVKDQNLIKELQVPGKLSPVEFIFVAVFIFAHKANATLAQLVAGIVEMRQSVRQQHVDVRMNTRVTKDMIDFIKKWGSSEAAGPSNKRKRAANKATTANYDEDDDEMEVDDGDDNTYVPKTKRKNTGNAVASTSKPTPPVPVKNEKVMSPPISSASTQSASAPVTDRMAAMKLAKAKVAQSQADRAKQIPSGPRATTYNSPAVPLPVPTHGLNVPPPSSASSSHHHPPPPGDRDRDNDTHDGRYAARGQDPRNTSYRGYR